MKLLKYISVLFCIFSLLACSNQAIIRDLSSVSLKCSLKGVESSIKTTETKVNNESEDAPVFISGVELKVENLEYNVGDVVNDFYFEEPEIVDFSGGDNLDIVLENITVGRNRITAKSVCENEAINKSYTNIQKCSATNLNDRASQYSEYLKEIHPFYADYFNGIDIVKDISIDNSKNSVNIPMTTDNHRLAVIIENSEESEYILKLSIEDMKGNVLLESGDFIKIGSQDAFVVNDGVAKGNNMYTVRVRYFTKVSKIEMTGKTIVRTINATSRINITKLYVFTRDKLLESSSSLSLTWKPMVDVCSGELIG